MNKRIAYKNTEMIHETNDSGVSVALSLDRTSVNYTKKNGQSDELYISPKNKQELMKLLNERMV